MFGLGIGELLLILAVVLLLFGGKKLPQLGAGLGQGMRNLRKAFQEPQEPEAKQEPKPPASQPPPPPGASPPSA